MRLRKQPFSAAPLLPTVSRIPFISCLEIDDIHVAGHSRAISVYTLHGRIDFGSRIVFHGSLGGGGELSASDLRQLHRALSGWQGTVLGEKCEVARRACALIALRLAA